MADAYALLIRMNVICGGIQSMWLFRPSFNRRSATRRLNCHGDPGLGKAGLGSKAAPLQESRI
jgi:hypothetical protein